MSMRKKVIAANVIKLLKEGYSPKEITQRMAVSYNYAWKLKKDLENAAKELFTPEAGEYVVVEGAKSVQEIDAILNTRATTYGSFEDVAETAQSIKDILYGTTGLPKIRSDQREALDMIASKIARIVNGDPNHTDSWLDIAGYATLVADRLQGKTR
jgi:transposase